MDDIAQSSSCPWASAFSAWVISIEHKWVILRERRGNPHFSPAYLALGLIQEHRGEIEEALASFERAIQLSPKSPKMRGALSQALALSGKLDQARLILRDLEGLALTRYVSPFEIAAIHFAMGEPEMGFEWLSKAFHDRCFELLQIQVDPPFDSLRDDPRFEALVGRLGFPARL